MKLSTIKKISKSKKEVYDITVENNHNFFCNGHLIHNCDYRGEILFRFNYLWQPTDFKLDADNKIRGTVNFDKIYKKGDTVGQLKITRVETVKTKLVESLDETERNSGGFGSTDSGKIIQNKITEFLAESASNSKETPKRYSDLVKERESKL